MPAVLHAIAVLHALPFVLPNEPLLALPIVNLSSPDAASKLHHAAATVGSALDPTSWPGGAHSTSMASPLNPGTGTEPPAGTVADPK